MAAEPAEHARFHAYLDALSEVSNAEECALLAEVLGDPDRVMADAAVIRHLDRRAAAAGDGEAFDAWSRRIASVLRGRASPELRLLEWSLAKDVDAGRPWNPADLVGASDWLQRRVAEHSGSRQALRLLADQGRTRRVRGTARSRLEGRRV